MNWFYELYDLYEKNSDLAGKMTYLTQKGKKGEEIKTPLVLLPVSHTTVGAQLTVTIDEEGNFLGAEEVAKEDKLTLIPVTEKSGSRTAGAEPHPFCDKLVYLAGDYDLYSDKKKKGEERPFVLYIAALERWKNTAESHPKVAALYAYLRKACLLRDLVSAGVILLDKTGKIDSGKKLQGIAQEDAFVRFRIVRTAVLDEKALWMDDEGYCPECWLDRSLQQNFIAYYRTSAVDSAISYLTGKEARVSFLHPRKIRNEGDNAKLLSANDETYFTFRGRFATKEEALAVGYEDSQKAHNALKWILRKQGISVDGLSLVIWESDLKPLPTLTADTDALCDEAEGWGDEEETTTYFGTGAGEAEKFRAAIKGYGKRLSPNSRTVLLALDAATTGRLALTEQMELLSSSYLEHLWYWHDSCAWQQTKFKNGQRTAYEGMVGLRDLAEALYGTEQNGGLALNDKNKHQAGLLQRLLPCICFGKPIPVDMVTQAVHKASTPQAYDKWYNWDKVLSVACALVKKYRRDYLKEEWNVALDETCKDRSYLYGRLLAVADRMEYRTYDSKEDRATNARRMMSMFSQRPFRTWKLLEERIEPYRQKLNIKDRIFYDRLMNEIMGLFDTEDFASNQRLDGLYLLGFHSQALALQTKKTTEEKTEGGQEA